MFANIFTTSKLKLVSKTLSKNYFWRLGIFTLLVLNFSFLNFSALAYSMPIKDFYVSPNGDDTMNTGTVSQPFKTIQKCASIATAGTICNIRAGNYPETVNIDTSGTADKPIQFKAYQEVDPLTNTLKTPEKVTLNGSDLISGTNMPNNVWEIFDSAKGIYKTNVMDWTMGLGKDQLFVDNQAIFEARWPNIDFNSQVTNNYVKLYNRANYTTATAGGVYKLKMDQDGCTFKGDDLNQVSDSDLVTNPETPTDPDTTSYKLSKSLDNVSSIQEVTKFTYETRFSYYKNLAIPSSDLKGSYVNFGPGGWQNWGLQTGRVTSNEAGKINIAYKKYYYDKASQNQAGDIFYLWGKYSLLDNPYEFFKDDTTNTLYFKPPNGMNPNTMNISAKKRNSSFVFNSSTNNPISYINITNINTLASTIKIPETSNNITLDKVNMQYVSHEIYRETEDYDEALGVDILGNYNTISNSTINFSSGALVRITGDNNTLSVNTINNGGYFPSRFTANIETLYEEGNPSKTSSFNQIKSNRSSNSGRYILLAQGTNNVYSFNTLKNAGYLTDDMGIVNAYYFKSTLPMGVKTNNEISYNDISGNYAKTINAGIYLDGGAGGYGVYGNYVKDVKNALKINPPALDNKIYSNTFFSYNSNVETYFYDCMLIKGLMFQDCMKNTEFKNNSFSQSSKASFDLQIKNWNEDIVTNPSLGSLISNPFTTNTVGRIVIKGVDVDVDKEPAKSIYFDTYGNPKPGVKFKTTVPNIISTGNTFRP